MSQKNETEVKILDSAKKVFLQKGFDGTRMQDIATDAGINKALLHYYFRNKEKLFEAIFMEVFEDFFPKLHMIISSDNPFDKKIELFVENYLEMLLNNPHLPFFIFGEITRNPDRLKELFKVQEIKPEILFNIFREEIDAGRIKAVDPRHLFISILGMCVFPFIAEPVLVGFLFNQDKKEYKKFLVERKKFISKLVMDSLKIA